MFKVLVAMATSAVLRGLIGCSCRKTSTINVLKGRLKQTQGNANYLDLQLSRCATGVIGINLSSA